ncbi:MAG TPA: UDP-N-acetylmuramoyl-tripeptide--D-alanyl-D-alanine ligase [Cyclobacteriaceae bacterium]|nr:UDP-N-acetylmuramoyl-tripeptide--D-alanyl-D-alanine ligase [Cyclobacteriaceae bacterium]HMV07568.1 UDP-N-acetylmuramoyl-tripeptide--D-alanyl-D-alanine ligase [Cyclobacteriaceae bacterium]HMV89042.1 UDP-N-acetylmuramoyl-tripeptide--D-alanyl-D-alanine ligase [Cyclobacteriaceae bacterium]HMW98703.1 UDP-N-acetylmuramoyl-tripeptide--D-alanyl-D-alanine ligase [Cyclobacteriaceae bacterium]HMX48663.1 UDP-N-acetylmuramoyl-tripeptide--D-alanyl-D-alanine ligase [Cyclobacteriaceae bacterium]
MDIDKLYQKYRESGKVSTDTRQILPGSVFFALKGDKFNANEFAAEALTKGASAAVVDEAKYAVDDRYFLVNNSLEALQKLARHHRDQLKIPVVGLTGSNGKTTSKELLNAVLSKKFKTFATKGNLNNHIGVPLTILSIDDSIELAIIEMGANHVGEIALLSSIANPTHGFITNIGKAHIGTFGGFENIIRGKSELYQHLITNNGQVFINSKNEILSNMAKRFSKPLFYPAKGDFYHCELLASDPFLKIKAENGDEITMQLVGGYNFENAAAALCIGKFFGVDEKLANRAVAEYVPGNMRSQIVKKESNTIVLDAYNANPSSMGAAIENLAAMKTDSKVAIVGDMFELEEEAEAEHRAIGRLLKLKNFNRVYLCGKLMRWAKEECPNALLFEKKEDLIAELKMNPVKQSTILVKASRGIGLETVVDFL